jgi:formylmethanofuran dehydrogenase subunit C
MKAILLAHKQLFREDKRMGFILANKKPTNLPLDLSPLIPSRLEGSKINDVGKIKVFAGKRKVELSKFFEVEANDENDLALKIIGDVKNARRIGYEMEKGEIQIEGNGGLYVGERMKGGSIIVNGDVDSWAGSSMIDGSLTINGSAGDFLAASYRGTREGMKGGEITVNGNVGCEAGAWMKGGVIHVKGSAGPFLGVHMQSGYILLEGDCIGRAGAQMIGGRIAILGRLETILPSLGFDSIRGNAELGSKKLDGPFYMFTGDKSEKGNGRVYVYQDKNPHLTWCEKYLGNWE